MESWNNFILQWMNCLLNSTGDCIQSTEELQDGKKYLKLISTVNGLKHKIHGDAVSEKDIVIKFLKDEYPNFVLGTKSQILDNLCIALLILSRLSLEPIFHKSLCTNLSSDNQIKIKSILESLYPLGKKVTIENLCSTFSILDKNMVGSLAAKPTFLLEDFLNSPVTKSVHSDSKIQEQNKQIRHLQADLETVRYEKSELIEDIKVQKKQIDELHQKLQETLTELKHLRQDSFRNSDFNGSCESTTSKSIESSYEKELQSLENYISELQIDNLKLQDEKSNLLDELKICQNDYSSIEEKSLKQEETIESLLLQIERKDDELIELKMKYEELYNYLKEKSKPLFINQSFDVDDRGISEISMNNSETLSSVIEIQLQDAKKEIIEAQNKYKNIHSLLTIIMEEYVKLKRAVQLLSHDNAKIRSEYETKYKTISDQLQNILNKEKLEKKSELQNYNDLDLSEIKENITRVLQGNSEKMKSLLLMLLNQCNTNKGVKKLNNYIHFTRDDENVCAIMESAHSNTLKTLQKYQGDKGINNIDRSRLVFKFYDILWQENWRKNLIIFFKALLQSNSISSSVTDERNSRKNMIVKYNTFDGILEKNLIKCLQDIYNKSESNEKTSITKEDLEAIRSDWILLYNDVKENLKIYKVLLLLERKWNIVSESLRNCDNYFIDDMRELLEKKDAIDSEFSQIFFMNSQILSFNFITATQLTTKIHNNDKRELHIKDVNDSTLDASLNTSIESENAVDLLTNSDCVQRIISIKKSIDNFKNLKKSIEAKPKIKTEWTNISLQTETVTELMDTEPIARTEYVNISIQTDTPTECSEMNAIVNIDCIDVSLQTESFTELLQTDTAVRTECVNVSLQTEDQIGFLETKPVIKTECANVSLQTEPTMKIECIDISMQTEDTVDVEKIESVAKIECLNVSLQTEAVMESNEAESGVKIEWANVSLQTDNLTEFAEAKTEFTNVSLQTDNIIESIEIQSPVQAECVNISVQTDRSAELLETQCTIKAECINVSVQTENEQISEVSVNDAKDKTNIEKNILQQHSHVSKENILNKTVKSSRSMLDSEEVQHYVKELHEKYELKLEKMKEKMKLVYNSQMSALKKDQESLSTKKLKSLEELLEQQCHNHSEELKKYKKHVSELSTQLWDVGEKLLIEKQKKEDIVHKYKELKTKIDIAEAYNSKVPKLESKSCDHQVSRAEIERTPLQQLDAASITKMQNVRNFQVMGNAFSTEDEEGELFDTTYNLAELHRSQNIPPTSDVDRLSILQMRNAKCKPHLKSSYAAEMQTYPLPVTEDEIKTGSASEEVFNDSLSQSLLTGKKVKRRDRTRNGSETPRRSTRRFSNIFRKPRLSLDRK